MRRREASYVYNQIHCHYLLFYCVYSYTHFLIIILFIEGVKGNNSILRIEQKVFKIPRGVKKIFYFNTVYMTGFV